MRKDYYHFIGVGGIGMSALARILLHGNTSISGSDNSRNQTVIDLEREGLSFKLGQKAANIRPGMTVVYSSAVKEDNPEYKAALDQNCEIIHRSELLKRLMVGFRSLTVTGTHGKTTTSSLLAAVMCNAGLDPSFAVGGILADYKSNGKKGNGEFFVAEADESDGTFIKYPSFGAIVTNIESEHLDHYGSEKNLHKAFKKFMTQVSSKEHLFTCGDDPVIRKMSKGVGTFYGFGKDCDLQVYQCRQKGWKSFFNVSFNGKKFTNIELSLPGEHNVLNALAVFGLAIRLGVSEKVIRDTFRNFKGVARRSQTLSEIRNVQIIDDYAHHPTEIITTLKAIRNASGERRIVLAFQPHRYSRTKDCMGSFGNAFKYADDLIFTDIYSAGEKEISGITIEAIQEEVKRESRQTSSYIPRNELSSYLSENLRPHDILVTMGAGDITKVAREVSDGFSQSPPRQMTVGIIQGGLSSEHEVSLNSAVNIRNSLNPDLYNKKDFTISREGKWTIDGHSSSSPVSQEILNHIQSCDILLPILHGPFGEDGIIQGFLETLNKPYVGCDHRSAAVCMDKVMTKRLMRSEGIVTAPFVSFSSAEWLDKSERIIKEIVEKLHFPLFVKPSHLGSSIGVSKVLDKESLPQSVEKAFEGDSYILVEQGIVGREMEFAVLGNDSLQVAGPGEVCTGGKVYDYDRKYGSESMGTDLNPALPDGLAEEGRALAKKAYNVAMCTGLARVDFFLDKQGKFWLNEINPMPGFTGISLYPKLWEAEGTSNTELMDKLIILGLQRHRTQEFHFHC